MFDTLIDLVKKPFQWIDNLFSLFGSYSQGYSKYFVYMGLLFFLSKVFKGKGSVNLDLTNKKK